MAKNVIENPSSIQFDGGFHFSKKDLSVLRKAMWQWYRPAQRGLPWRVLWNKHRSPYHIWVSEIMLQQTTIKAVLAVYEPFFEKFPTVEKLAKASEEQVRLSVRGLGYYRRFSMMHRAAQEIAKNGWPLNYKEWLELPGIGPYTGAAISSITLDEAHAVVDGNIERIFCRLFDVRLPSNDRRLKPIFLRLANELLDSERPGDFNQAMMELGQIQCRPIDPACGDCPLRKKCLAYERSSQELAPAPKIKKAFQDITLHLTIRSHRRKMGLTQRGPEQRFLKNTWGFETNTAAPKDMTLIGTVKHNITHHNIRAKVWVCSADASQTAAKQKWLPVEKVEENLVSNLDRKAFKLFLKSNLCL